MSYKITIEKTVTIKKIDAPEYTIVGEQKIGGTNEIKKIWGYPPEREIEKEISEEIFTQFVEDLDLYAVIQAVNKKENEK